VSETKWIKIRDGSGREGYIDGRTRMSVSLSGSDQAGFNHLVDDAVRDAAVKKMIFGGIVCALGIALTLVSSQHASGGRFVIFCGAIGYGAFSLLKGLFKWLGPRQ
jgi:hypothetical protein